jgi:hypothetical protein
MRRFKAKAERFAGVGTFTYATIPFDCEKEFGSRGRIRVKGEINGHKIRAALLPHGDGKHYLVLTKEIRDRALIKVGDTISVDLAKDTVPQAIGTPDDFLASLEKNKKALENFNDLALSYQKQYVVWLDEAKKAETRQKRITKAVDLLALGRHLK